jgi:hypothetical protein
VLGTLRRFGFRGLAEGTRYLRCLLSVAEVLPELASLQVLEGFDTAGEPKLHSGSRQQRLSSPMLPQSSS